jgi:methionyl-tRNA formyltransferase
MTIIFFGSDDFAVTNLHLVLGSRHKVLACVTQPDRPQGRHLKLTPSAVKEAALAQKIPVLQPTDLKDTGFLNELQSLEADVFVVIAYGRILPPVVLEIPKQFCVNMHGSLLPQYRGAAPINWAIINGDDITGVSAIRMNEAMDTGDIVAQDKIKIAPEDTAVTLRAKMAELSGKLLIRVLDSIESGEASFDKQDEEAVSQAPKLTKDLGLIRWDKDADAICRMARGLLPWPCAYTYCNGKVLKVLEAQTADSQGSRFKPGQVITASKDGIVVAAGKKAVVLRTVRPEGSKSMSAASFLAGHPLNPGFEFGST